MSKAFTDEEAVDATVAGRAPARAARGQERPITPEGHRALREGLRRLVEEERPAALALTDAIVREARLRDVDHRIALATAALESVRVVTPAEASQGSTAVVFGCRVTLEWEDGRRQEVRLVGPDEVDARAGHISVESPLGRALLGQEPGDTVEVARPRGREEAMIVSVKR
ncbi:MAG TPA: GreA/GreB family elongation factor [Polyangia bacterium]|jgi:transcription elongation GreA/GreB family factor|nr:GreA/GreB family elongation factor [Polyangia bacterium]